MHSVTGHLQSSRVCACVCYCPQGCPQSFLEVEFLEATYQEGQVRKGCPQRESAPGPDLCAAIASGSESGVLPVATRGTWSLVPCAGTEPAKCEQVRKCNPLFLWGRIHSQGGKYYISPFLLTQL